MLTRRTFLGTAAGGATILLGARPSGLKIGVMDTVLRVAGKPQAVAMAQRLGFAAVQVTLGRSLDGTSLPLEDPVIQSAWISASKEHDIPLDADLTSIFAVEIERNREAAEGDGVVASAVGVDVQNWKVTRVVLSEREPTGREAGHAYQVLYLAKPLLAELPKVDSRQRELAAVRS